MHHRGRASKGKNALQCITAIISSACPQSRKDCLTQTTRGKHIHTNTLTLDKHTCAHTHLHTLAYLDVHIARHSHSHTLAYLDVHIARHTHIGTRWEKVILTVWRRLNHACLAVLSALILTAVIFQRYTVSLWDKATDNSTKPSVNFPRSLSLLPVLQALNQH